MGLDFIKTQIPLDFFRHFLCDLDYRLGVEILYFLLNVLGLICMWSLNSMEGLELKFR